MNDLKLVFRSLNFVGDIDFQSLHLTGVRVPSRDLGVWREVQPQKKYSINKSVSATAARCRG